MKIVLEGEDVLIYLSVFICVEFLKSRSIINVITKQQFSIFSCEVYRLKEKEIQITNTAGIHE